MLPSIIWMCVGVALSLPGSSHQSCTDGTPQQCLNAEFAPGTNLAGEGFDITKMERKGAFVLDMNLWRHKDKTCTLCSNPYVDNRRQKLPLAVVDWRAKQSCSSSVASKLYRSSEALVTSSTSSVENNWKSSLDVDVGKKSASLMLAGTDSRLSEYSMSKTKEDKFSFSSQGVSCQYYSYRITGTPKLHREFHKAVKQLPKIYNAANKRRFYKLIDNFGTHYITKVKLGGSVTSVTSIRQCEASLEGLSAEEVQFCLEAEASVSIKVNAKAETRHCNRDGSKTENSKSFSDRFSERFTEIKGGQTTEPDLLFSAKKDPSAYKQWLDSLPLNPDIVSYSLDSLHELLPVNTPVRKNLRTAISHYILEKGLLRNCTDGCRTGVKSDSRDPCVCQCHNQPAINQDCCPTRKGAARVVVTVQQAFGLWGDQTTATDGYVKVKLGRDERRTRVILNNNNPHWATIIDFGTQDLTETNRVRFEVWDQDSNWDDDLLGECQPVLSAGMKEDLCVLQHGRLFFKLDVRCAPNLSGEFCSDYKASPMTPGLKKTYVSRHARPVPRDLLLQKGVFVSDAGSLGNTSHVFGLMFP
ncbi:unnamed protein product [Ophioblennius macclurei]